VEVVKAALRRFVLGGKFTVVTADCKHHELEAIGDIRELKGGPPPLIELRFKPPKDDLRLFGRFVGRDSLVLTTYGMKSLGGNKNLSVPNERQRCDQIFKTIGLKLEWVPTEIKNSISDARFSS
jgi:hypothetical protein